MKNKERTQDTVKLLLNAVIVIACSLFFYYIWYKFYRDRVYFYQRGNWLILSIYIVSLTIFTSIYGGFKIGISRISDLLFSQTIALFFSNACIYILASLIKKSFLPLRGFWIYFAMQIGMILVLNYVNQFIFYSLFKPKDTILVYGSEMEDVSSRLLRSQAKSYTIKTKLKVEDLKEYGCLNRYDCVMVYDIPHTKKEEIIRYCFEQTKSVYVIPSIYDVIMNNAKTLDLIDTPMMKVNNFGPSQSAKIAKRAFDIVFALVLMVITSPFWLITAICIKAYDRGPVFYRQVRVTQYGREFKIIKFRSMKMDAEKDGVARLASENDDRITPIGKFIRACRIDELPQLWNILVGDMSVVGPRPERPELIEKILIDVPEFNYRLKVKAGLTGYAQVYGKYNTKLKDKLLYDLYYTEKYSIMLDIKIMFMTFKILFLKESTEGVQNQEGNREGS